MREGYSGPSDFGQAITNREVRDFNRAIREGKSFAASAAWPSPAS